MDTRTRKKIHKLQLHLRNNYKELFALHPGNVVGVRINKKIRAGKTLNYHAVIFHVVNKIELTDLEDEQLIPRKIVLTIDGENYSLFTDVEEVGEFQFQYAIGDTVADYTVNKEGTLGLFLTDGQYAYGLTNYHVAAWNLMENNQFYYDPTTGLVPDTLTISGVNGLIMNMGQLSSSIDAAFINLGDPNGITNAIGNGNQVNSQGYVNPDSLNTGDTLYAFPSGIAGGKVIQVVNNSTSYDPKYKGITFDRIIAVSKYSNPGDSGSIVVGQDFRVVGIVVGADRYSYLIPFSAIYAFNPLNIL